MPQTRIRVQLQEGHNDLKSITNAGDALTYLQVAMAVRTLHDNTADLFPKKSDQLAYKSAADRLCQKLKQAMEGKFLAVTAGNQFREQFQATRDGRAKLYRIDVEINGELVAS